ncbi:MAG TPA: MBL fold metallo-hydrolase [Chloroflexota bacterium]|nr:MBL fold metallo-hydrolase [Chloroflexota bacterium]
MEYLVEEAAPGLYALAVWDESWNSFNNCYVLRPAGEGDRAILIDSGKAEHAPALLEALARLGVTPDRVDAVVATHGHLDHVGGAGSLPEVPRHLHAADAGLLPQAVRAEWRLDLPDHGVLPDFLDLRCVLLGHHTFGSVALFHEPTRALLWGDHVCFFGAPLDEGLVGFGSARRERMLSGVAWRRAHWPPDGAEQARIRADLANRAPEDQRRHDFPLQVEGLARALSLGDADVLCTGHGPVLRGEVAAFLADLVAAARG